VSAPVIGSPVTLRSSSAATFLGGAHSFAPQLTEATGAGDANIADGEAASSRLPLPAVLLGAAELVGDCGF
jgi:hypothetical protein